MNRIADRLRTGGVDVSLAPTRPDVEAQPTASSTTDAAGGRWWALFLWAAVIVAARIVLVDLVYSGAHLRIPFPPLDAALDWRPGWPLLLPVVLGVVLLAGAREFGARARWSALLVASTVVAAAWAVALALLDGTAGVTGSVTLKNEYFRDIGKVGAPLEFLGHFTSRIAEYRIHVQGHPPGYLLFLSTLDRIGLAHAPVVATIEILGGALAVPAVLIAVREVAGETRARAAWVFVAAAPLAIWIATSADALYAGVGAWAIALVVLATGRDDRGGDVLALAGGLLFGVTAFLSYGLVLLAVIPLGIALHRRRVRPLLIAAVGASFVFLAFALAGFWWFAGLAATRARYHAGVASRRPYDVFLLVNLACLAIATGPAIAVALARLRDRRLWWLVGGALAAIGIATLSGMSKGEVERIWLPFSIWVLPAGAALAASRHPSRWLAVQLAFAIGVQTLVRSPW
jgi:methylthioxylose transferase